MTTTGKEILVYQNFHDIISFIKQYKIKHGPMKKLRHNNQLLGHVFYVYKTEHMVMLNLAFADSFKIYEDLKNA